MSQRTVAIVGGGLSGLAAAKAMSEVGLKVRIFEASPQLGGMWTSLPRSYMRTNISRHTCVFSDHPWSHTKDTFPLARDLGQYLNSFATKYLSSSNISLEHRVVEVTPTNDTQWHVRWTTKQGDGEALFDYLVVASGFFSETHIPSSISGAESFRGLALHSSQYRDPNTVRGKRVVIVGDSYSAVELAGEIAPLTASLSHIAPRPFWIFPRYMPLRASSAQSPFAPIDLTFYRRSTRRTDGEDSFPNSETITKRNQFFRAICGDQSELSPDAKLVVPESKPSFVTISEHYANSARSGQISLYRGRLESVLSPSNSNASTLVLSDGTSLEAIDVLIFATGFSTRLPFLPPSLLSALSYSSTSTSNPFLLYRSIFHPSLPNAAFIGMYRGPYMGVIELQSKWVASVFSESSPSPSNEAMEKGLVLETQIRERDDTTGNKNGNKFQFPHADYVGIMNDLANELKIDPLHDWRELMTNVDVELDVVTPAQYYAPPPLPSQLLNQPEGERREIALSLISETNAALADAEKGKWVAAAVASALPGQWNITRRLESRHSALPSGTFKGTATFTRVEDPPNTLSDDNNALPSEPSFSLAYLERGTLSTDTGLSLEAQRRYRYTYSSTGPTEDILSVYFDDYSDKSFFHALRFLAPGEEESEGGDWAPWKKDIEEDWSSPVSPILEEADGGIGAHRIGKGWCAMGEHMCAPDYYVAGYWFKFGSGSSSGVDGKITGATELEEFRISYRVKGPKKDYTASAVFTR